MKEKSLDHVTASPSDLEYLRAAIVRHPWVWFGIVLASVAAALAANRWVPRLYEATTTVVYESSPDNVQTLRLAVDALGQTYIQNQIEEIKSRVLAEEILAALAPEHRRAFVEAPPRGEAPGVERLRRSLDARAVKDSDVIRVRVRAEEPVLAAAVANTLTNVLRQRNVSVRRQEADALYRFLDEQVSQVTTRLGNSEDSLHAYKSTNQVVPLDKEAEALLDRSTDLEVRLNQVIAERRAQQARLGAVRHEIANQEGDLKGFADPTQPWLAQLRQKLVDLEMRHATLAVQDYSKDHPQLVKLEKEIEETRARLATEVAEMARHQTVADPLARRNDLILETLNLEMDLDAARAKEKALREALQRYEREADSLPAKELEMLRLSRNQQLFEKLYLMLNEKREEARIAQAGEIGNVRVIDRASVPSRPIRPRPLLNLVVALLLGTAAASVTCLGLRPSTRLIHSLADAERKLQLGVVAEIPRMPSSWSRRARAQASKGRTAGNPLPQSGGQALLAMEAFRGLAARFLYFSGESPARSLLVTSAVPGEGKSTIALHLALLAAEAGARTLLVDGDFRRPSLHRALGLARLPGLTDLLQGAPRRTDIVRQGVFFPTLDAVPAGAPVHDPLKFCVSPRFAAWLDEMRRAYDLVVVDGSPVLAACDAAAIARHVDGTLVVVRSGRSMVEDSQRTLRTLQEDDVAVLGIVLNDVDWRRVYGRGYYYGRIQRYYTHPVEAEATTAAGGAS